MVDQDNKTRGPRLGPYWSVEKKKEKSTPRQGEGHGRFEDLPGVDLDLDVDPVRDLDPQELA